MINKFINLLKVETKDPGKFDEAIRSDIGFKGRKLWILIFAVIIASIGLNINTQSIIIGAMLISPIMGPINGLGYGLAISDKKLICDSVKNFILAIVVTLVVSSLYFLLSTEKEATSEIMNRTNPSFFHILIGISGGIVGILAKSRKEDNNVVPGVAIATALLPPVFDRLRDSKRSLPDSIRFLTYVRALCCMYGDCQYRYNPINRIA
ncbi:MAG: DUF389 domain-containing protein [Bacteroidales bacterium]|nr:DUF389 domain-containing protein [Bacteroidales bacterium]